MHPPASGVRPIPRDSNGNFTLPSGTLVNTGDTVLVSQHNPAMQDIAQGLTNSVDRSGSGGMLADLSMNNNKVTGLADGVADTDAATVGQLGSGGAPVGAIFDYAGSVPPTGFLLCYGQAVSRSTYADLFAAIGTAFGTGDGSTTFNLPDLRGRVGAGKDDMGGAAASRITNAASGITGTTLGAAGGGQTHTLTEAQMPAHAHGGATSTAGAHSHSYTGVTTVPFFGGSGSGLDSTLSTTGSSGDHSHTISSSGGGGAHPNVQPTLILNKIIKVAS